MITRGANFKQFPIDIAGSSTFGRYPKISNQSTYNMFTSDNFLVDYAGYQAALFAITQSGALGNVGRAIHTSTKLNRIIMVIDANVWMVDPNFDQSDDMTITNVPIIIGTINSSAGPVYITENNKPQVVISDNTAIYFFDPSLSPSFQVATKDGTNPISFTPGYIDFHDTYILAAASNDLYYSPPANNTWRLGIINPNAGPNQGKLIFPDGTFNGTTYTGLLQTKPDNVQAVVRFPSRGNMIMVMGKTVSEPWYDVANQLFPYQRSNSYSVDYGCISPATVATLDEIVVWLAQNEKSGPIIMYSTGGEAKKITTDGIDYLFAQLTNPADSQGFLYRQDGHLFYHINFYTDNLSLFYDFNTDKFYNACDENLNYFIAAQIAFFNNQYYFVTKNNGFMYAFDTIYTTFDGAQIPRIRRVRNARNPDQSYSIMNDVGFTIEQGDNNPLTDGIENIVITNGGSGYTSATVAFVGGNGLNAMGTVNLSGGAVTSITITNPGQNYTYPPSIVIIGNGTGATAVCTLTSTSARVDLSVSYDGGETFGSEWGYVLNPNGLRKNKLQWWQLGIGNDVVLQFRFNGFGRFLCTDGFINMRQ